MKNRYKTIRVWAAVVCWSLVTGLFLDFTGTLHPYFGFLAKLQFLPALLAANVLVVLLWVAVTFVFGRIYCSVVCPLGVMQDIVSYFSGKRKKFKYRFSYSPEKKVLRYAVLAVFIIAVFAGVTVVYTTLAPYSSYGRIVTNWFAPVWRGANNVLAYLSEQVDSYAFYHVDIWIKGITTFVISGLIFIGVSFLAWKHGRTYCNTICPVGTLLGFISRHSLLRITVDTTKCNSCGLCSRKCKAACIDARQHSIDGSRCVTCFDCIETCKKGALSYKLHFPFRKKNAADVSEKKEGTGKQVDENRRKMLMLTATLASTSLLANAKGAADGFVAATERKSVVKRKQQIVPPGALSARNMADHCTACQLCVNSCPNHVLQSSDRLETFMQPVMSYEHGFCRSNCNTCSQVCPAGAIRPISLEKKVSVQVGHAVWIAANCVVNTDGVSCGNCERHCPNGAIMMVAKDKDNPDSLKIPVVDTERCIGCGACEYVCPARPFSAIYVEGHENHRIL